MISILIAAVMLFTPQDTGELTLPVGPTSSLSFALLNLQSRGVRFDPGEVRVERVRTLFTGPIRANSHEDLLRLALAQCDPPLEYELIERGRLPSEMFVRLRFADPKRREASGNFQLVGNGHIRLMLEKVAMTYQGTRLDTSGIDWTLFVPRNSNGEPLNILTRKYVGNTIEELLADMFSDTLPRLRAVRTGDRQFRIEVPYPIVGIQLFDVDKNDPSRDKRVLYKKLDHVLAELSRASGYDIRSQVPKSVDVRVPHKAFGRRSLDEVLQEIARGSTPRLEILDLDPDAKSARVVVAAASGRPLVVPQPGHRSGVQSIERSPDGRWLISEGKEGTINVWSLDSKTTLRSYIGKVAENAFSLDSQLAIVSRNNTIARYSFVRNRPEVIFGTGANITSLSFSPEKNWVWAGSTDGVLYVVNQADATERKFFTDPPGVKHISTTRAGTRTAVYVPESRTVAIWDTSAKSVRDISASVVATIQVRGAVKSAKFSPDGTRLAVWHEPGAVSLFDGEGKALRVSNGQYPGELVSFDDPENPQPTPFSFSTSGRSIAIGNGENQMTIFDAQSGQVRRQLTRSVPSGGGSWILSAACWLSEGTDERVVVGLDSNELARDEDKLAEYDLASGQRITLLKGKTRAVSGITFSRDGRVLVAQEDDGFRRWDVTMRMPPSFIKSGPVAIQTNNWITKNESDNGVFVVGVANERPALEGANIRPGASVGRPVPYAKRWFFGKAEAGQTYPLNWINPANVTSVELSGDGQRVAWIAQNHIFMGEIGELSPRKFVVPESPIIAARLSATGRFLVTLSGQARGVARIWDLRPFWNGGEPTELWKPTQDGARNLVSERSIAVDKQRDRIAISIGGVTSAFSLGGDGSAGRSLPGQNPSWSDDGRYLAVEERGVSKVYAVGVDGNNLVPSLVHTSPSQRYMPVLSPSGGQVVTFSADRLEAYYQNWSINRSEAKWDRHRAPIAAVAFSPIGGIVATSSDDGTIWIYGKKKEAVVKNAGGETLALDDRGGHPLVQLRALDEDNFVVTDIYNQYWASKEASSLINFTAGGQSFSYSQFDRILNRPHEVMKVINYATGERFGLWPDINLVESAVKIRMKYGSEEPLPPIDDTFRFEAPSTPIVELQGDPKSGTVTLEAAVSDPFRPLTQWNVTVNNVPELLANGGAIRTDPRGGELKLKHSLRLLPGENTIRVWTVNDRTVSSLAHEFRVTVPAKLAKPNLVVFAVGISKYPEGVSSLPAASRDALRVAEAFRRFDPSRPDAYGNTPYGKVNIVALPDKSKQEIMSAAAQHLRGLNPQDHAILMFAGHGLLDEKCEFHFAPYGFQPGVFSSMISFSEVETILKNSGSRNMLVLFDACQAGALQVGSQVIGVGSERKFVPSEYLMRMFEAPSSNTLSSFGMSYSFAYLRAAFVDLENSSGATVLSAVTGSGTAFENKEVGNFTKAVLEAFTPSSGADENKDGKVSVQELKAYVVDRVPRLDPAAVPEVRQRPSVRQENIESNFAVYTYGVGKKAPAKKPAPKKKGRGG